MDGEEKQDMANKNGAAAREVEKGVAGAAIDDPQTPLAAGSFSRALPCRHHSFQSPSSPHPSRFPSHNISHPVPL